MPGELQIPQWEWWIIGYFFLGGIAGGAYFTSAIIELVGGPEDRPIARMGYYIAFPLALVCALFLALDLGLPLRFWHMLVYTALLGAAVRFVHFALFEATLLSPVSYAADTLYLFLIGALAWRMKRAAQMATQYYWLYERTSPLTWRERAPGEEIPGKNRPLTR